MTAQAQAKPPADLPNLAGAFEMFVQASQALEQQYAQLQEKVEQLDADLIRANERLRVVLDALPAAVLVIENQTISHFNAAAKELFPDWVSGQAWRIPASWQLGTGPDEYMIPLEDGTVQTWQVKRADTAGRSVVQIQDITANLQTLEASERTDRLAAMGQMSAGIAHQIRTPLATAMLYAAHLSAPQVAEADRIDFATKLQNRLIHLEKMASEMLQFIKGRPQKTTSVPVLDLIAECCLTIDGLLHAKQQQIEQHIDVADARVRVDRPSVVSAVVAILENAIQISPAGARISLEVRRQPEAITVRITDQGPGIAHDMLDCLFEPFATNRSQGTGLGLAIALNAIRAHRGDIQARNLSTGGAEFTITLPKDLNAADMP